MGNVGRRIGRVFAIVGLAIWLVVGGGATPVFAAGDLRYASNTVYTVDPVGVVHVALDLTLTNTKADSGLTYYYFDKVFFSITANAVNVSATRNGQALSVTVEAQSRFVANATVRLSPTLRSRQTQQVHVTWDIPASGARVSGTNRINPAYMTFVAFGFGDPGLSTISVRIPDNFEVDVIWQDMDHTSEPGVEIYTASNIADPAKWVASVTASDDDALTVDAFTVAGHDISIRSWPDDPQWGEFVKTRLSKGIPALEKLIGSSLPTSRTLQITETATPYIYGYAGWYTPSDNTIEIGDRLDPHVILHEVSHAWFNRKEFTQRWVSEGFAEDFGARAVKRTDGTVIEPKSPDAASANRVTLNDWSDPDFDGGDSDLIEGYGYNASFYLVHTVSEEIGTKKMAAVVQSAFDDHSAYGAHGKPDKLTSAFDWRNLLDAFELVGGSKQANNLFRDYVVTDIQRDALVSRAHALKSYRTLAKSGGDWAAPKIIRERMTSWSFAAATTSFSQANKVLRERDALHVKLKSLGVALPRSFQNDYENADSDDLDAVLTAMQTYERSVDVVISAQRTTNADRSVWQSIGLLGADTERPMLNAVSALERNAPNLAIAYSNESVARIDAAERIGIWRAVKLVGALFGLLLMLWCCHLVLKQRRDAEAELAAGALHH